MTKSFDHVDVVQEEDIKKQSHHDAAPTSAFATLTRAQCVRKFWRLYITGLGVSLAGMYVLNKPFRLANFQHLMPFY